MNFVPKPVEILSITRAIADDVSCGDQAWCRMRAGLLAYLMEEISPTLRRGSGIHPATGLPIGIAIHAAIIACNGELTGIGTCRALQAALESTLKADEDVVAHATIVEVGRRHITCRAEAYAETKPAMRLLARVTVILVRVVNGKAVPLFS